MLQAKFICSVKRPKRSSKSSELPAAIAALKTEMEKEKEYLKAVREREDKLFKEGKDLDEEKKPSIEQPVYFTQRAYPLLEMFELSLKDDTPVVWGV